MGKILNRGAVGSRRRDGWRYTALLCGLCVGACGQTEKHSPPPGDRGTGSLDGTSGSSGDSTQHSSSTSSSSGSDVSNTTAAHTSGSATSGASNATATASSASSSSGGATGAASESSNGTDSAITTGGAGGEAGSSGCLAYPDEGAIWGSPMLDLEINGSGFDAYSGSRIRLIVTTNGGVWALAEQDVVQGEFRFEVPDAASDYTNFALYVDQNLNAGCDADEPVWSFTTGPGGCHVAVCPADVVVENIDLPLEECVDCGPWRLHPLTSIGVQENCQTGVGRDLSETMACTP